ncbi:hypothetical protein [Kitasatospora sp. NPDC094016]|uniref:hypothetical protein n=1 Tax=Kitasatospora sp. NPDC094016 TaxID=3154986 RepID=UPI00331DEA3F
MFPTPCPPTQRTRPAGAPPEREPGTFTVAIVGGTGAYRTITGDGTLEYTTADGTTLILNHSVQ